MDELVARDPRAIAIAPTTILERGLTMDDARTSELSLPTSTEGAPTTRSLARADKLANRLANKFTLEFEVRWADCDPNRHLRHSAFADYATHVRFQYIEAQGFALSRFEEERFGPVIFRDETQYLREIKLGERIRIDFECLAFSDDGTRWSVMHTVYKENGKKAALLFLDGGWMSFDTRKLRVPPEDLLAIMKRLPVGKVPSYRRFLG
jgi:acyl-CoA thioester hydrolase